jgi:hypothetical protein
MDAFNIICGIVTIASFVFALWLWIKTATRVQELTSLLAKINAIALLTVADSHQTFDADREHFVRKAERALGYLSSVQKLTQDYASSSRSQAEAAHLPLVEQGILWTKSMIWEVEMSKETAEVWMYTPDLKPDSTEASIGKAVMKNLRASKNYVYFFPNDLPHRDQEIAKLLKNVGASDRFPFDWKDRIKFVPIENPAMLGLAYENTIFYFRDGARLLQPRCFEEIKFTKVASRGTYWQEHSETRAAELQHALAKALVEQSS